MMYQEFIEREKEFFDFLTEFHNDFDQIIV